MEKNIYLQILSYLPVTCGLLILFVGYIKLWRIRKADHPDQIAIFEIWLIGIITLLTGIYGHIYSIKETMKTVALAGDISASFVADNMSNSYNYTLKGLIVLIISLITWGILKAIKHKRTLRLNR